jgi:hypothetical protein
VGFEPSHKEAVTYDSHGMKIRLHPWRSTEYRFQFGTPVHSQSSVLSSAVLGAGGEKNLAGLVDFQKSLAGLLNLEKDHAGLLDLEKNLAGLLELEMDLAGLHGLEMSLQRLLTDRNRPSTVATVALIYQ